MLHPSYSDLMKTINSADEPEEDSLVNSRYAIVLATAKRARQLIDRQNKENLTVSLRPLSEAVAELQAGKIKILPENGPDAAEDPNEEAEE